MLREHPIEALMEIAMNNIKDMIDVDTIVGEPIYVSEKVSIIPISKVCFGFVAGGSEFNSETVEEYNRKDKEEEILYKNPFGGGSGAGVHISPIGFLCVDSTKNECPRFIPIEHTCMVDKLLDYIPDIMEKISKVVDKYCKPEEIEDIYDEQDKPNEQTTTKDDIEKEYFEDNIPPGSDGEDFGNEDD